LIDHILVSRRLADQNMQVTVHRQTDASVGVNPIDRRDAPASDHDPVIARLNQA